MRKKTIPHDKECQHCGSWPELRKCERCGLSARIVDCGHQGQPRPLAADEFGYMYCDDCYEHFKVVGWTK